ncbi:MAG: Flp pilus assembly protein CpaB [Alsobacter sp.]
MSTVSSSYRQPRRKLNIARMVVLAVAIVAGTGAAWLAATSTTPVPTIIRVEAPPSIKTTEVLVLKSELKLGSAIKAADLRWQIWPVDGVTPGLVTREATPEAMKEIEGSVVLSNFAAGEPVRPERIVRSSSGGLMAAMLPPGLRALAINIDGRGSTSAGGFILPNDRVDVIKVTRDEVASRAAGAEVMASETILRNVRVLAIGKSIQDQNGEKVSVGETATLELDPRQVETVFLAQRTGQLTLSLRSLQDASRPEPEPEFASQPVSVRYNGSSTRRFTCTGKTCDEGR